MKTKQKPIVPIGILKHKFIWILAAVLLVTAVGIGVGHILVPASPKPPEVITVPTLEKIIILSDLSTSTSVYNGIAEVCDPEDPEKVDYYVSYEAKVKAGIDFSAITIDVDQENKQVIISLPEVRLTDVIVDIASMDYIFFDDSANTSTVSEQAYKACEADVQAESQNQDQILELARQNAENAVLALVDPFVKQADAEYNVTFA